MPSNVLILGGTKDAREIAAVLVARGYDVTTSLAGVTQRPILPDGKVRTGGFGGAEGLRAYLVAEKISILIDATHPYAAQITRNASEAIHGLEIQHLRLERPAWFPREDEHWIVAKSTDDAVRLLPSGARVLLTIGRKEIAPFMARRDLTGVVRMIEMPRDPVPAHWVLVQERPPFAIAAEVSFMRAHAITHLVTKNAGSFETCAKLEAAHVLSIPVVMIRRPVKSGGVSFSEATEVPALLAA